MNPGVQNAAPSSEVTGPIGVTPSVQVAGPNPQLGGLLLVTIKRLAGSRWAFLLVTILVASTFLTVPRYTINNGVESAWSSALDYAHYKGLQFGKEIVFPYGPLGFLLIPHFVPHTDALRLVFDCLLCLCVSASLCLLAWRFPAGWKILTVSAFTLVAANKVYGVQDLLVDVELLSLGLLCLTETRPRLLLSTLFLIFFAAFSTLAKVTYLLTAGLTVCVVSVDLVLQGRRWLGAATAAGFLMGVCAWWAIIGQELSNFPVFLWRSLALCSGYDQAMALAPKGIVLTGGLLAVLLATSLVLLRCFAQLGEKDVSTRLRQWFVTMWLLSLLFLSWKHGFVRADQHHNYLFFGLVTVFVLLLEALPQPRAKVRPWTYGIAGLTCLVCVASLQISLYPESLYFGRCVSRVANNVDSLLHKAAYMQEMDQALTQRRHSLQLPGVSKVVGPATVDVFGNHQTYAILNELNYRPRPVFQSYAVYNPLLSELNSDFYLSDKSPQYVLATLEPIDQRFPPLEDPRLLCDLLINSGLRGTEGGFLLLQTKSHDAPRLTLLSEGTVRPGQPINLGSYGETNLWLQIDVEPAKLGRLRQFVYQLPSPHLRVLCDGSASARPPQEFCSPAPMLSAGFVASPMLANDDALFALYTGKPVTRPAAYSLELGSNAYLWKPEIKFRIYRIENAFGRSPSI